LINCNRDSSFRHATLGLSQCVRLATFASPRSTRALQGQLVTQTTSLVANAVWR
jgi:hypothetical protein